MDINKWNLTAEADIKWFTWSLKRTLKFRKEKKPTHTKDTSPHYPTQSQNLYFISFLLLPTSQCLCVI